MGESSKYANDRRSSVGPSRKKIPDRQQANMSALDLLEILLRRKWRVIIPVIICTGTAVALAFTIPPSYLSTTLILVERQQVPEQYVTPTDTTPVAQKLNTIKQQMLSRTNLEQIIKEFKLLKKNDMKEPAGLLYQILSKLPVMWRFGFSRPPGMEDLVEQMRKNITVTVIGERNKSGGDAFTISYIGKDPQITMEITNTISTLFIDENLKLREQYAEGTSEFLSNELKKAKKELEEQENAFRIFKERYIGSLPEQIDANLRTLDRLQLGLQSVRSSLDNAKNMKLSIEKHLAALDTASLLPASTLPISFGLDPTKPLEEQLETLKAQLIVLLSEYTEKYPDVVSTKKQINKIENLLADSKKEGDQKTIKPVQPASVLKGAADRQAISQKLKASADLEVVHAQIKSFQKQEATTKRQITEYEKRVEDTPANEQRLAALLRNYEMSQNNYQSLLQKKLSAQLAENLEKRQKGERFRIIDPANLPEKPFKPDKSKITLLGILAGAGIAAGLIYMVEFLNPAFRKQEDFEGVLAQPVLAVIPLFPKTVKNKSKHEFKDINRIGAATTIR